MGHSENTTEQGADELRPESDLGEDILSIIHVFSCRHYGRRKYKRNSGKTEEKDEEVRDSAPDRKGDEIQEDQD